MSLVPRPASCAKVNCKNKKNLSNTLAVRCCGGKAVPKTEKEKQKANYDVCGDSSTFQKLTGFIAGDKKIHECADRFDKQFRKDTGIPNLNATLSDMEEDKEDEGGGDAEPGSVNPASGCPNPAEGDWVGALWKPLCELGHGAQAGAEGSIPSVAILIGGILVLLLVMKL